MWWSPTLMLRVQKWKWRTGRKLGRTIYAQLPGKEPSDNDVFIGIMETTAIANIVVESHNRGLVK